jgi:hypothetical protein
VNLTEYITIYGLNAIANWLESTKLCMSCIFLLHERLSIISNVENPSQSAVNFSSRIYVFFTSLSILML